MALRFDNPGTCLIVQQYLERSRNVLRSDLMDKIQLLFSPDDSDGPSPSSPENKKKDRQPSKEQAKATGNAAQANTITV